MSSTASVAAPEGSTVVTSAKAQAGGRGTVGDALGVGVAVLLVLGDGDGDGVVLPDAGGIGVGGSACAVGTMHASIVDATRTTRLPCLARRRGAGWLLLA